MPQLSPVQSILSTLSHAIEAHPMQANCLYINVQDQVFKVCSNQITSLQALQLYFKPFATWQAPNNKASKEFLEVHLVALPKPLSDCFNEHTATAWQDWQREPGKTGRKEAILDTFWQQQKIRLVHKIKTGMLFIQPAQEQLGIASQAESNSILPTAIGPAETFLSQIINFILTQTLNHYVRQGEQLAHTAGLFIQNQGLAFAGLSGGGKSTLMLQLLPLNAHFISNDRLLLRPSDQGSSPVWMRGIPKQPRINPGTIVHNPQLHTLLSPLERQGYLELPTESLRQIEKKHDAPVHELFQDDCYQAQAPLNALIILNWQPQSTQPTALNRVDINARDDLLAAVMKPAGPFFANNEGSFLDNGAQPEAPPYLELLSQIPVLEISGKIDFEQAKRLLLEWLKT